MANTFQERGGNMFKKKLTNSEKVIVADAYARLRSYIHLAFTAKNKGLKAINAKNAEELIQLLSIINRIAK